MIATIAQQYSALGGWAQPIATAFTGILAIISVLLGLSHNRHRLEIEHALDRARERRSKLSDAYIAFIRSAQRASISRTKFVIYNRTECLKEDMHSMLADLAALDFLDHDEARKHRLAEISSRISNLNGPQAEEVSVQIGIDLVSLAKDVASQLNREFETDASEIQDQSFWDWVRRRAYRLSSSRGHQSGRRDPNQTR